ncbi:hypothetical protein EZJ49_06695 [Bdellovibrio bacteriovorus]|uniref:DUF6790 family protein n=1 Tax=Bdellovibrio bacteriovorus TaxID=959 RepID=UPI0021CDEE4B|nr:DUF6790 family protein [Bdellovibrio bacteriovorus]UXR65933.1 hypothetical protein EZJ49_06695 [Bdellovibrio bacteriovorus]
MIEHVIRFVLSNLPSILFFVALLVPTFTTKRTAEDYLKWLLLLSVGVDGVWVGLFHIFLPQVAAGFIGWQVSPFQYEVGVSDFALGVIGIMAFRRPLPFKAAVVTFASLFFVGAAIGHVREIVEAGNFSPGNGGLLLVITIIRPVLMITWLLKASRKKAFA